MLATCGSLVGQTQSYFMYFSVLEGIVCLWMGWPPVFRDGTCFSDSKMRSCQLNVVCVSLVGCLRFSECPGAGRWLKKLTSATGFLLFSVRQFHSLVSQVNPPRAGLPGGWLFKSQPSPAQGRTFENFFEQTSLRLFQRIWCSYNKNKIVSIWASAEFPS